MKAIDIIEAMDRWAPKEFVDSWDNTGFQIGDPNKEVTRILVALDLDKEVLNKAIYEDYQMIITHHPIIFKPLTSLTTIGHNTSIIYDAVKYGIVVYNAHSNLDLAEGGVNDSLADVLELKDVVPLSPVNRENLPQNLGYGRVGYVDKIGFDDFLSFVKEKLSASHLVVYGDRRNTIEKVAICGGSGSDFILDAYNADADIYISGDIKYHEGQYGHELGLTIVDAGHFNTEKIVLPTIKTYLEVELENQVEIQVLMESSLPQFIY